ncbi:hypothetical protein BCh11DRAFT_07504 [Burkholderia sp. Ch1-1]|nr:hypothetical protein BCh11DRAFT_07504 [Burkholderia sp. Ch1-1]
MKKIIPVVLTVLALMGTSASAQKPPRQAGASGANSDQQGWAPGPPLLPSKKANIHKPASGTKGHGWFGHKKGTTPASTPNGGAAPAAPAGASQ